MVMQDGHALVIGISQYQRVPPTHVTQDAQDVAAVLQSPEVGGYPPGAVRVLLDAAATRDAIYGALDALAHETTEASTVLIYYSGHGAHAGDAYYLIPVEGEAATGDDLARTAISNAELSARLGKIAAGRLTVVLDCCRAAGMVEPALAAVVAPLAQGRGRAVIAASRAAGATQALPGRRDSPLTGALIEGLRSAVPAVGGVVRICDLFDFIQQQVAQAAIPQHPVFKAEIEENYPIAQRPDGAPAPLVLPPAPDAATYDAFISYSDDDPDDSAWVTGTLAPALERLGLRLCLERNFAIGGFTLDEDEDAVTDSRYTVAVFSPSYLKAGFSRIQERLAMQNMLETGEPRLLPLVRRACKLPLHTRMMDVLDVSRDAEVPAALQRLAIALRHPPRARSSGS